MQSLMTTEEVADYLKVSEKTVRNWRMRHEGPQYIKMGVLVRYKREDVDDYLQKNITAEVANDED